MHYGIALSKRTVQVARAAKWAAWLSGDLDPIVADDERMLRRLIGKNIELTTELKSSVGLVRADTSCMHQALLNLAVNARDAMPKGGRLIIALTDTDIGEN